MTVTQIPSSAAAEAPAPATPRETSLIPRFVALLTPVFVIASAWVAGLAAQVLPGLALDQGQIATFMTSASVAALASAWKWLQGWQQHERRVAEGSASPVGRSRGRS
jgi:hypothetical protein